MKTKKTVLTLTQTALLTAVLIGWQVGSAPLGNQILTGSGVNMILVITVMVCGTAPGLCVAAVSPAVAFLFGLGPKFPVLLPFIVAGNVLLVLTWRFVGNIKPPEVWRVIALLSAASVKCAFLWLCAAKLAIPLLIPQAPPAISAMFSFPQFVTASIGGAFALSVIPALKKADVSSARSYGGEKR
ncbi:MAG: hypothetical protein LBI38_00625 [Oscillospiraceae bacterium]|nr:hypothetical protein [Oscillospiraceae bacterium]